jgi:enamidase
MKSQTHPLAVCLVTSLLLFSSSLALGEVSSADLAIRHARLIDGTGTDPVDNVTILISNRRVTDILPGSAAISAEEEIDARGFTVVPGLVDAHSHSLVSYRAAAGSTFFSITPDSVADGPRQVEDYIQNRLPIRLLRYLQAGVTTLVDPSSYRPFIFDVRDRVNRGDIPGPRLFITGPAFTASGGHPGEGPICAGKSWCVDNLTVSTDSPEEARRAVDELAASGVDGIKVVVDDLSMLSDPLPKMKREVLAAIVEQAHRHSLPVVAHVLTSQDAGVVVEAGVDALVHVPLRDLFSYETASGEPVPALLSRKSIPVVTTVRIDTEGAPLWLRASMPFVRFLVLQPSLEALRDAGVVLVLGTDFSGIGADPQPGAAVRAEAEQLVEFGFTESEVLQMATGNAARFPMIPNGIGTIAPGSYADLLFLRDDPLEDIGALFAPTVVIKDGIVVVDKR